MNRTKATITDALVHLLEEKPYNKITVKDISDYCHINRNTFYYYFHDIPEALENIMKKDADFFIANYSKFGEPIDCLLPIVEYCLKHKKMILHIYRSVQCEIFLSYLKRVVLYATSQYVNTVTAELPISSIDKKLFIQSYKCVLVGVTLDWLDEGMNYDLIGSLVRIGNLFSGSVRQAILKSAESTHK